MSIYSYEQAFGAWDKTSQPMRRAVESWFDLYYGRPVSGEDACQKVAYTVVNKLIRTIFGEYAVSVREESMEKLLGRLDKRKKEAVQLALVGGECYIKPWVDGETFAFTLIPRNSILVFARNAQGEPTDLGTVEKSTAGKYYYTLLERRTVDEEGYLTITNRLYRSLTAQSLGSAVPLSTLPAYAHLADCYRYETPVGSTGLVRVKTPMLNCVDGTDEGVSVYAAAADLIHNIDRNEAQINGEFSRGESRVFASADLLSPENGALESHLFVGLDEAPDQVGLTVFSPQLREQSYLARKQEYLRNVESIIGLRRGTLSDANETQKTATEISSSTGDFNLTVIEFQQMWQQAVEETIALCGQLAELYGLEFSHNGVFSIDWGNGVLFDQDKTWQDYKEMVSQGLIKPEIALGWRFGMPADSDEDLQAIRQKLMPQAQTL